MNPAIKEAFGPRWMWFLDPEHCFDTLLEFRRLFGTSEQTAYNIALLFPESYRPRVINRWRKEPFDIDTCVYHAAMKRHDWASFVEYLHGYNKSKPPRYVLDHEEAIDRILVEHRDNMSCFMVQAMLRLHMWFFWGLNVRPNHFILTESLADGRVKVELHDDLAHDAITIFHERPKYNRI